MVGQLETNWQLNHSFEAFETGPIKKAIFVITPRPSPTQREKNCATSYWDIEYELLFTERWRHNKRLSGNSSYTRKHRRSKTQVHVGDTIGLRDRQLVWRDVLYLSQWATLSFYLCSVLHRFSPRFHTGKNIADARLHDIRIL